MAGDGGDVHQAALAGLDHLATKALRGDEIAGEVDVEHLLPVAQRQVLHSGEAQDAGGVDEDVDAAEVGDGGVDGGLNLGLVGGVHLVALGVDAKLGSEVGGSGLDLLLVQVEHDDVGAIAGELAADLGAHTAERASHGADIALELKPIAHRNFPSCASQWVAPINRPTWFSLVIVCFAFAQVNCIFVRMALTIGLYRVPQFTCVERVTCENDPLRHRVAVRAKTER